MRIQKILMLEKWTLKMIKIDNLKKIQNIIENTIKLFSK